jgi:hypothetical protein
MSKSIIYCTGCQREFPHMLAYRKHLLAVQLAKGCGGSEPPIVIERPSRTCEQLYCLQKIHNANHVLDLRTLIGDCKNDIPTSTPIPQPYHEHEPEQHTPPIPPPESTFPPVNHTSLNPISSTYQPDVWSSAGNMIDQTYLESQTVDKAALPDGELDWFDRSQYNRVVDGEVVRYVHRTAGRILGKSATVWETLLASREKEHPNSPWYPFPNESQWKLGHWLATCKSSQSKIDELIDTEGVSFLCNNFMSITDRIGYRC